MKLFAALTAFALLLTGCGNETNDDGQAETVTTATSTVDSANEQGGQSSAPQASPDGGVDPATILVDQDDLPSEWTQIPPSAGASAGLIDCFEKSAGIGFDDGDAKTSFQRADSRAFLGVNVTVAETEGEAEDLVARYADAVEHCHGRSDVDEDGTETTWSVWPWKSFPDLGDRTFAHRLTATTDMGPIVIEVVLTRVREVVVLTMHMGIGAANSQLTEQVQRTQAERI